MRPEATSMAQPSPTAKELLARLVAFDTTSHKTNIPLIEFVEAYLAEHGIASQRVPTADGLKSSLFATIGPAEARRHRAVRPHRRRAGGQPGLGHRSLRAGRARRQALRPRHLRHEGLSRLRARSGARSLKARKLKVPFHLAFSYDEEVGCTGVRPMVGRARQDAAASRASCSSASRASMSVVDAHKGPVRWRVELTGRAAHSSMPHYGRQCHRLRRPA